jgi:hypothetical protein
MHPKFTRGSCGCTSVVVSGGRCCPCPLPQPLWWRQRHGHHARIAAWCGHPDVVITIHNSKEICGSEILAAITSRSTVEPSKVLFGINGGEIHEHQAATTNKPQSRWVKSRRERGRSRRHFNLTTAVGDLYSMMTC